MTRIFTVGPGGPLPIRLDAIGRAELDAWMARQRRGAEIGVWRGEHAAALLEQNPALELLLVDPYEPQPGYQERKNHPAYLARAERMARERLRPFGASAVFVRKPSTTAAAEIADASLDFVFIDADHSYAGALADLKAWAPKVRPGGLVCGHDYGTNPGRYIDVERAVLEYTAAAGVDPWFITSADAEALPCFAWPAR